MNEIEKNKINKNDTKHDIAEKINKCNSNCIENLKKYEDILNKLAELKDVEENISAVKEFVENYLLDEEESGINKIEKIKQYFNDLFNYRINKETAEKELSIKSNIEDTENKINELYNKIFCVGDNEEKSIEDKLLSISELYDIIIGNENSIKNKIENYNNEVFPEIQRKIEESEELIEEYKQELIGNSENDKNSIKYDIQNTYDKIKNYNEELFIDREDKKSIKTDIMELIDKIKEAETERKNIYQDTKKELDTLLPDAGSIGLAYDYNRAKQDYGLVFDIETNKQGKPIQKLAWFKTFCYSYFFQYLLFIFPLILISKLNYLVIVKLVEHRLSYFPVINIIFTLPLLWISYFSSKNIILRRRMYEEYNHKEKVLKMFSSLRDELRKNEDVIKYYDDNGNEKELTQYQRLIEIVLNTIEYNPSKILGVKDENFLYKCLGIKELKLKIKDLELKLKASEEKNKEIVSNSEENTQ